MLSVLLEEVTELGQEFRSEGLLQNCILQVRVAGQGWRCHGHAVREDLQVTRMVLTYFFLYQVPDKGLAGQSYRASCSQEPAAPRSQAHPYAMLATGNMQSLSPNASLWERQGEAGLPTREARAMIWGYS